MERIDFKDLPNTTTPITADNLNLLQDNVENEIEKYQNIPKTNLTLSNTIDLNDLVETAFYTCGGNAPVNSPQNTGWNGCLLVFKSYYVFQIIFTATNKIWFRYRLETNEWTSWKDMNS